MDDNWFSFAGNAYYPQTGGGSYMDRAEGIQADFAGMVDKGLKGNGIIWACERTRVSVFSEAMFKYRRMLSPSVRSSKPTGPPGMSKMPQQDAPSRWDDDHEEEMVLRGRGDLFGNKDLGILEHPWPGAATGDFLTRALYDVDFAGNSFWVVRNNQLKRLRPDWVTIITASPNSEVHPSDPDAELFGYIFQPGGLGSGQDPIAFTPDEVAHFAPYPDPTAYGRGMSWLNPIISEIRGDKASTEHKLAFFSNGATPQLVVSFDSSVSPDAVKAYIAASEARSAGAHNAYKTMYMGGGSDAKVVGADLRQLDFTQLQGHAETRIAAAAGVPPVIVGLSEGLQAATYSNYGQARRSFADVTVRPLWRNLCGSLENILKVPAGASLWYDEADIAFLREDRLDAATIAKEQASTINTLITAGFKPDAVVDAVTREQFELLKGAHTGLYSVQLQPPVDPSLNANAPGQAESQPAKPGAQPGQPGAAGQPAKPAATTATPAKPAAAPASSKKPTEKPAKSAGGGSK